MAFVVVVSVGITILRPGPINAQQPPLNQIEFAMVGDSILAGRSAGISQHSLTGILGVLRPNWFIKNFSFGGGSLAGVWTAINPANQILANADVKKIVLILGTNDWRIGIASSTFETKYRTFLQVAGGYHPIICVTPLWRSQEGSPNSIGMTLENYRQIIRAECVAKNFPVIEGTVLIPANSQYFLDGIHPNVLGYQAMAQNLAPLLDPHLQ